VLVHPRLVAMSSPQGFLGAPIGRASTVITYNLSARTTYILAFWSFLLTAIFITN